MSWQDEPKEEKGKPEEKSKPKDNYKIYHEETGKNAIRSGKETKTYQEWLKNKDKKEESDTTEKEKKSSTRTWKDEITEPVDANLQAFVKDLRKDLGDYIISLKTEKTELTNKLKNLDDLGYICIIYGIPGIGKSTFCASGVLDGYTVVFLDLTLQGRRLTQFPEIKNSPNFLYEPIDEKDDEGKADLSKNFELLAHRIIFATNKFDPKKTIIIIDGWSKAIEELNSYLRLDILKVGEPKRGRQNDVGYGDWYWRSLRYQQLLFSLESAANSGFKIFLTAEVKDVTEKTVDEKGKFKIRRTGERAASVRDEDLYTADIEAYFRNAYDPEKDIKGPREIEIMVSKVPGINVGSILTMPKLKDFLDLKGSSKKLVFGAKA